MLIRAVIAAVVCFAAPGRGLIEPVEELRGGASMIPGQAVACACSVAVGVA